VGSNELETLFIRAFSEPALRPAFLRLLMRSEVLALTVLQPDEFNRAIVTYRRGDGALAVPVFTSEQAHAMSGSGALSDVEMPILTLITTRELMNLMNGYHVHLNPGGTFSRNFSPEEVAWLLNQKSLKFGKHDPSVLAKGMNVKLKKLDVSLPCVETALTRVFLAAPEVARAFLVEVDRIRQGCLERTLMVIVQAPPSAPLSNAVCVTFGETYDHLLLVDLCFDEGDRGAVQTLARIGARPFYERPGAFPMRVH
jgi:hypothetical protein